MHMHVISEIVNRIVEEGFNPLSSPFPHKVAVMLTTAQGLIDNGGFEYLFENPFDPEPIMDDFILVYKAVGAESSSCAFREALIRHNFPESRYDDLNKVMWKNSENNFKLLEAYISSHVEQYA